MTVAKLRILYTALAMAAMAFATSPAAAQTDAQFSQYYEIPAYYNAAAIGTSDYINIRGGGRLQWLGIDNAPRTFVLQADMPFRFLGKRFGTGLGVSQESVGLFRTLDIAARIGYKFRKLGGEFTVGVGLGIYDQQFKGSETFLPDDDDFHQGSDDGVPTQDLHGTAFNIDAGVWYVHKYFQAGISATHITSPTVTLNSDAGDSNSQNIFEFQAGRNIYFMAIGNIPVKNTLFEVMPSVFVKTDFHFTTAEITARARYARLFSFGVGYRLNDAITATVAAEVKNFFVGYAYDYPVSNIAKASSGSHELFAGYRLKLDLSEKNRNRHKSIRIM